MKPGKKKLDKFGNNPIEEPEIYDIFVKNGEDMLQASEELLDYLEKRVGEDIDFEFMGAVVGRVLSKKDEKGVYKTTEKLINIEPLKPRDLIAFMRLMEKKDITGEEALEWLKDKTNIPDDLHPWEITVLIETLLQYGVDGMKTVIGSAAGN
jgi:hypothetical protein